MSSILLPGPADISDSLHTGSRNHGREKRRAIEANTSSDKASSKSGSKQLENRKLRASCDSCYLAKIKCGKERPKCTRCVTHGTPCLYSPSQRIGKPRRNPPTVSTSSPRQHRPNISIARQLTPLSQQRDDHDSASLDERHGSPSNDKAVNTSMLEWPFHLTPPNSDTSGETSVPLTPGLSLAWQQALHGPSPQPRLDAFTDGDQASSFNLQHPWAQFSSFQPSPTEILLPHHTEPAPPTPSTTTLSTSPSASQRPTSPARSFVNSSKSPSQPAPPALITPPETTSSSSSPAQPCNQAASLLSNPFNPSSSPSQSPNQAAALLNPISVLNPAGSSTTTCTCTPTVLLIMQSLHDRFCSTPFDAILAANKIALSRLSTILSCPTCTITPSLDSILVMTLAATILKLVAWYEVAARPSATSSTISSSASAHPRSDADTPLAGTTTPSKPFNTADSPLNYPIGQSTSEAQGRREGPITLGAYTLDTADEAMIKTPLVLSELRKVDTFLLRFGSLFHLSSSQTSFINPIKQPQNGSAETEQISGLGTGKRKHNLEAGEGRRREEGGEGEGEGEGREGKVTEADFYPTVVVFLRRKVRAVVERLQREMRDEFADVV